MKPVLRRPRILVVLLALAFLAVPSIDAATQRVRVIDSASAGAERTWSAFDTTGPALFDIDGDGNLEIVDQNQDKRVVVIDGVTGKMRAELETRYPPYWGARAINEVTVAVMAPGEAPSLIVANSAGIVTRFQYVDTYPDGRFQFQKTWDRRLDAHEDNPGMDGTAIAVDLDGDGLKEVLGQSERVGVYALRGSDGTTKWSLPLAGGNADPGAGDLDGDGIVEAVFVSDGGHVVAIDGPTGKHKWTYWAGHQVRPGSISVGPLLSDLDGDGTLETVVAARDAHDRVEYRNNHFTLIAIDSAGKERWVAQPAWGNPLSYTHLQAADVDGDGRKEVFGMDWNTIGHKPGNWEVLGPAHVFSFSFDGQERWHVTLDNIWSNDDIALVDADADGQLEVLAIGTRDGRDGLWVLDAATGTAEEHVAFWPWKSVRGPEVGDLDGDGTMEYVVSVHANGPDTEGGAFLVFRGAPGTPGTAPPGIEEPAAPLPDEPAPDQPSPDPSPPRPSPPQRSGLGGLLRVIGLGGQ